MAWMRAQQLRPAIIVAVLLIVGTGGLARAGELRRPGPAPTAAAETSSTGAEFDQRRLEAIFTHWQARQSDIATARITYRSFHNSVDGRKSLAEFDNLLDTGQLDHSPDGLRRFITTMNGGAFPVDPPWGDGRVVKRDTQHRNDLGPFVTVEDRETSIYHDSLNNQFDAFAAGGSRHRSDTLATFRPLPPEPWTAARWMLIDSTAKTLALRRILSEPAGSTPEPDARTWFVDPASGIVTHSSRLNSKGEVQSVARYLDLMELADGITFPRLAVEATMKEGVITVLHVCAIDSIHVNEAVPDADFKLSARANSRIVDHRGARKLVSRLDQDQADLMAWLKNHIPGPPAAAARVPPVDRSIRNAVLGGNGLLLVVVGVIVWKRHQRNTARS